MAENRSALDELAGATHRAALGVLLAILALFVAMVLPPDNPLLAAAGGAVVILAVGWIGHLFVEGLREA